jgi:hypothetical protein
MMYGMGKTDDLRALEKNCQLNSSTMLAQKRKKQKIIFCECLNGTKSYKPYRIGFIFAHAKVLTCSTRG